MNAAQTTMEFIQTAEIKRETTTQPDAPQQPLKRRVHSTGVRHGKAFGNVGVVTTAYTQGFFEGLIASFKED